MNYYDLIIPYLNEEIDYNYFNNSDLFNYFIVNYINPFIRSLSIKDLCLKIVTGKLKITTTLLSTLPKEYKKNPFLISLACAVNYQFIKFWEGDNTDLLKQFISAIRNNVNTQFLSYYLNNIPNKYINVFKYYSNDKKIEFLISNFIYIIDFIKKGNLDEDAFINYLFGNNSDYLTNIINLYKTNSVESFFNFYNYYKANFKIKEDFILANDFMLVLNGYLSFKPFFDNLSKNNIKLDRNQQENLKMILDYSNITTHNIIKLQKNSNYIIKDINDLNNLGTYIQENILKKQYLNKNYKDIAEIKDDISLILFGCSYNYIIKMLGYFGDTEYLRKMIFDNRDNPKMCKYIEEMIVYTTTIENLRDINNVNSLIKIKNNIINNYNDNFKGIKYLNNYIDKMRELYSIEAKINLTNSKQIDNVEEFLDNNSTKKYGVKTYDYRGCNYKLLAHVLSENETVESLFNSKKSPGMFICLSAISYLKQILYRYNPNKIVFGYDDFPMNNYICSSEVNMGSNGWIRFNDSKVPNIERRQRDFLDCSKSPTNHNSEYLFYRKGLKPSCIILPNGREPTYIELEIAKKYNLYFVKTQKVKAPINNKKRKLYQKENSHTDKIKTKIEKNSKINSIPSVINKPKTKRKKIAIFTDSHGLFEPTLAILEDARKRGCSEIYSLGDNIGTGPNPKEVMELIKTYNVKSIKGNHECYLIDGIKKFRAHLNDKAFQEANKDVLWTINELTNEQLSEIKAYPNKIEIEIGGKKVLLCHYTKDYNTNKMIYDPNKYYNIFQGHEHFDKINNNNIINVRAAGIGGVSGIAQYLELIEKEDGNGYDIIQRKIPYDLSRTAINLIESNSPSQNKMTKWVASK